MISEKAIKHTSIKRVEVNGKLTGHLGKGKTKMMLSLMMYSVNMKSPHALSINQLRSLRVCMISNSSMKAVAKRNVNCLLEYGFIK